MLTFLHLPPVHCSKNVCMGRHLLTLTYLVRNYSFAMGAFNIGEMHRSPAYSESIFVACCLLHQRSYTLLVHFLPPVHTQTTAKAAPNFSERILAEIGCSNLFKFVAFHRYQLLVQHLITRAAARHVQ